MVKAIPTPVRILATVLVVLTVIQVWLASPVAMLQVNIVVPFFLIRIVPAPVGADVLSR